MHTCGKAICCACLAALMLTGCRTVRQEVPVEVRTVAHDTLRAVREIRTADTILLHDSVHVTDSVEYRYRERVAVRWRIRTDTVMEARTDTVRVPVYISRTSSGTSPVKTREVILWLLLAAVGAAVFVTRRK